jgi:hypothetical protein
MNKHNELLAFCVFARRHFLRDACSPLLDARHAADAFIMIAMPLRRQLLLLPLISSFR